MTSLVVYAGLLVGWIGVGLLLLPIRRLGLGRRVGLRALGLGAAVVAVGLALPIARETPAGPHQFLDSFLPEYDVNEVAAIRIHASPERVDQAIRSVRAGDVRFLAALLRLRALPGRLVGAPEPALPGPGPLIPRAGEPGPFLLLGYRPREEIVIGVVGRFWQLEGAPVVVLRTPEDFARLGAPGLAKAAMNFRIVDQGDGWCRLSTETRVRTPDDAGRMRFLAYWKFVHPGSAMLRLSWLQAIQRHAES